MIDLSQILADSLPIVRETGLWIQGMVEQVSVADIQYKGTNDLVSYVDQQAENRLKTGLSKVFPEAGFIA